MSYNPNAAKSIFLQALDLASAAERTTFVQQSCAGQPELQARVELLLKTALAPDSLLDSPLVELDASQMADAAPFVSMDFLEPSDVAGSLGRLGGYTILDVIGRGGMGIVLRAMDTKLNRVVAIKVLAPEFAGNPQARRRFLREAQAAAAVSHDHVVTIFAVGDNEKLPYLVMECIVGQSLQQKIDKQGALGLTEILRIGMQIAAGLSAAHKQGLVHRDIKPANILLENGVERVKITDFGLARSIDDVGITVSGQIAGTPQYMSPEQAMGQPVDQRSDLFSLGSVLYTLCTGRPAFGGDSAIAVLRRVCDDHPRPITELNTEIPDWLVTIVDRLMAKRPEDRLQTANEVHELLQQWLAHCQQPASAPRPMLLAPIGIPTLSEPPPATPTPRRNRIRVWLAVTGLLIVTLPILMSSWFQLWSNNMAGLSFESPDGSTAVEIVGSSGVVARQTGWGRVIVPPGHYGLRVEPKPNLRVHEIHLERRSMWPWRSTTVKLTSAPQAFPVSAGERWGIWVTFEKSDVSLGPEVNEAKSDVAGSQSTLLENEPGPELSDQARKQQEDCARQFNLPVSETNSIGMKLTLIPPGKFLMGSSDAERATLAKELEQASEYDRFVAQSSAPQHPVELTQPFYIGQHEVTVAQFQTFVSATNYQTSAERAESARFTWKKFIPESGAETRPVCGISWMDAIAFCEWLSESESTEAVKRHYDLPTEAQWEYACRGGQRAAWHFGDLSVNLSEYGFVGLQTPMPLHVGQRRPNAFGLYDMHGNVSEWCRDWHNVQFYAVSPLQDPVFDADPKDARSGRVVRGGSWNGAAWWSRSATRGYDSPTLPVFSAGFRVVRTVPDAASVEATK
ncbi:MAG: SUMF1/EgtB/PvdO family nonheme iron enzyme [Planctomycetes bacterium]|nr:SUMF1/EgtB/PvdO family nonheme iron enzyme [Planctomycetota bacterium]